MRFKRRYAGVLFLILLLNAVIVPQTVQRLRQRYGAPENGVYLVRPNVTMKVSATKDGRVCKMLLEPKGPESSGKGDAQTMSPAVVEQILDEEVPKEERGRLVRSITFGASCTSMNAQDYENVRINRVLTCATEDEIKAVEVVRKVSGCQ